MTGQVVDRGSDLHTHSDLTDGTATPEQMADAAVRAGLRTWALSDHVRADSDWLPGYAERLRAMRRDGLQIRCGVEAKILDRSGRLDLPQALPALDHVLIADHQFPGPDGPRHPRDVRAAIASGAVAGADVVDELVTATCASLSRSPFRPIVVHPFSLLPKMGLSEDDVRIEHITALAAACLAADAAVEINEKWRCPSIRIVGALMGAGVPLVAGSDAHRTEDVGAWSYLDEVLPVPGSGVAVSTVTSVLSVLADLGLWGLSLLVLLGALPNAVAVVQVGFASLHRYRDHYDDDEVDLADLPRVAVLVPAWNEAPVLRFSVDRMLAMEYPADRLRVAVVDDASTDETPELLAAKMAEYPGRILHLRREKGGQGKAHTLNHGLREILSNDWAQAVLITDADVVFERTAVRRMTRHLGDPSVGSVTAFIKEASQPPDWMNRYIGYEYAAAQAVGRRAQNFGGAQACLAGGAQLHSRHNIEQLGSAIDTSTLAEDTVTTLLTQLAGRRVIFDGNAHCLAEEPGGVVALWKQRLRWGRGNLQVGRRFKAVFFHPSRVHRLGRPWFGLTWWTTLLLPAFMVLSSAALVTLWWLDKNQARLLFTALWITNALGFVFTTTFNLLVDRGVARRSWRQALAFPGLISLAVMAWVLVPRPMHHLVRSICIDIGLGWSAHTRSYLALAAYLWVSVCMIFAWAVYRLDKARGLGRFGGVLMFVVGYGPLLCAITFASYVAEARGAASTWDKTEKTGKVGAPA